MHCLMNLITFYCTETAVARKPKAVGEQIVTDEKGRRRFHGAFTGGFSAGYFNTVGTREGWTPSTFKSSRARRTDRAEQRPEDFMDKEVSNVLSLKTSNMLVPFPRISASSALHHDRYAPSATSARHSRPAT